MSHDWIVSVLEDLRSFARRNGYRQTAGLIDDTIQVAVTEIGTDATQMAEPNADSARNFPRYDRRL